MKRTSQDSSWMVLKDIHIFRVIHLDLTKKQFLSSFIQGRTWEMGSQLEETVRFNDKGHKEPAHKYMSISLEMKLRMMHNFEGGQNLSPDILELGFAESTVNTTVNGAACIEEIVKRTTGIVNNNKEI